MSEKAAPPAAPAGPALPISLATILPPGPLPDPASDVKSRPCSDANFLARGEANNRPEMPPEGGGGVNVAVGGEGAAAAGGGFTPPPPSGGISGRLFASPLAKKLASEQG